MRLNLVFDWQSMGIVAYVPLIILVMDFLYGLTVHNNLHLYIPVLEYTIPAFSAWWSIFLLQDILEEEGTESILSYPVSRWNLGFTRLGIYFLLYTLLIVVLLLITQVLIKGIILYSLIYQIFVESFFFSGLGFFSMVITKNSGFSLGVIIVYISIQILTKGLFLPYTNIYIFNDKVFLFSEIKNWSIVVLMLSLIFWIGGQGILNNIKKFN